MRLLLDVTGTGREQLDGFAERAADVSPAWPSVVEILLAANREHFDTQGSGEWEELSPQTIARKARARQDPRILRATGALFDALTSITEDTLKTERPTELRLGTVLRYARLVNRRRPVIALAPPTRRTIRERLRAFLATGRL